MAGLQAVWDYVALHVVTCLVPAFLLAGAMVSLVPREQIVARLGVARGVRSLGLAAVGSLFVAACSCTVIPVASGLYYGGSGVGPAFVVLWVAPAANILALTYTGALLGGNMAVVRLALAMGTALLVGAGMMWAFRREEATRARDGIGIGAANPGEPGAGVNPGRIVALLGLLVVNLLAPNYLVRQGPYLHKVLVWGAVTAVAAAYARRALSAQQLRAWLHETWWFVRLVFPLLLGGVFLVGILGALLPPSWIERWLGGTGLRPTVLATLLGAVSYFATMTEAPFVARLMDLGMGKGPALALLLAGPGLSLPNMLAIGRLFGARKATAYVSLVVLLASLGGWAAGRWVL